MSKIINTSYISSPSIKQPFTGPSLKFLQDGTKELVNAMVASLTSNVSPNVNPIILYGCKKTHLSGSYYQFDPGYFHYQAELFYFSGATSISITDRPICTIVTLHDPVADPLTFTDTVPRNVHNNRIITISNGLTGTGDFDYDNGVLGSISPVRIGEVSMYAGNYADAIDGSGLGINEWYGWALCDGGNGTADLRGRFIVGYSDLTGDYNTIGNTGGAKDVTLTSAQSGLPAHSHGVTDPGHSHGIPLQNTPGSGGNVPEGHGTHNLDASTYSHTTGIIIDNNTATDAANAHENRPPYYTLAYMQRIF